jgi:hypothetical protein
VHPETLVDILHNKKQYAEKRHKINEPFFAFKTFPEYMFQHNVSGEIWT